MFVYYSHTDFKGVLHVDTDVIQTVDYPLLVNSGLCFGGPTAVIQPSVVFFADPLLLLGVLISFLQVNRSDCYLILLKSIWGCISFD